MIEGLGGRAFAVMCNVTRTEDVKAALDKTIETFRGLDFAFNNAGVEQRMAPTAELEEAEWDRIVHINSDGWASPKRSLISSSGCVQMRPTSSSGTLWPLTAGKRCRGMFNEAAERVITS